MEQYLLVDFGAEVVVEAIGTAGATNGHYLKQYMVEYARSDGQYFNVPAEDATVCAKQSHTCTHMSCMWAYTQICDWKMAKQI